MVRTFQPGDEDAQVAIYNRVAASWPGFKPAKPEEIRRRTVARRFRADLRFIAEVDGQIVGYCNGSPDGRVSYPWCLPGHESYQSMLMDCVIMALQSESIPVAYAAYHQEWTQVRDFLTAHQFVETRQMVNYVLSLMETPTLTGLVSRAIRPIEPGDINGVHALGPDVWRCGVQQLESHLFRNAYFPPESIFVMQSRSSNEVIAVALVINEPSYADPTKIDPSMPCFRLAAFGTEGTSVKRIHGMYSVLTPAGQDATNLALDMLGYAIDRHCDSDTAPEALAAQVPSDVPRLVRFYDRYFRKQGSFPVFERRLSV